MSDVGHRARHANCIPKCGCECQCGLYPVPQKLLSQTAVLKLNGGLGTSMGLEKAKSLLEVSEHSHFPAPCALTRCCDAVTSGDTPAACGTCGGNCAHLA